MAARRRRGKLCPSATAPGASGLTGQERAELLRLRAEVLTLQQRAAQRSRRHLGWRTPVSVVLIVLDCVLAPLSVVGEWTANQISNTDRYVANMAPLISEPAVQRTLTDRLSNGLITHLNIQGLVNEAGTALWTYGHRAGLRIGAVVLAGLVFVFWSQPTGLVALVIALLLLIVLGLIELVGRPPAVGASPAAGAPQGSSS